MLYLVYATLIAWLVMVFVNYRSHTKYIVENEPKFIKILDDNFKKKGKIKGDESSFFSFTSENIEKREFTRYLNIGKLKYIISDSTQIVFSIILLFILAYGLEYLPFSENDKTSLDFSIIWKLLLAAYIICVLDVYLKTLKYDQVVKSWEKKHPGIKS